MIRPSALASLLIGLALSVMFGGCSQREPFATAHTSKARHKATMRTYHVHGRTYRPTYVNIGDTMKGISSWYGPNFHGNYTSNGEIYNMHKMTAAHKTWPMDTIVKVHNLDNGRSVIVRINDRGPYVRGRVIDCSYAAGKKLGLDHSGIAHVKLTVLGFAGKVYKPDADRTIKAAAKTAVKPTPTAAQPLPKVRLTNFGIQLGAFRQNQGATAFSKRYEQFADERLRIVIRKFAVNDAIVYRVFLMGFASTDEAKDFMQKHHIDGSIVRP